MNKSKTEINNHIQKLEAEISALKATAATMPEDTPSKWVPKHGDEFYCVTGHGDIKSGPWSVRYASFEGYIPLGNVHRTREDAERYKLRLESFVPALGPETPDLETLLNGWFATWNTGDKIVKCVQAHLAYYLDAVYQNGTWHPTRKAAEEWLAKYGEVRGFRK